MPPCLQSEYILFAEELARASAEAILPYVGNHGDVAIKSDDSPVTHADRAAEKAMRTLIHEHFPSHGIIGEEYGTENPPPQHASSYQWVLDPIDGTRAFIAGDVAWGTLIALCEDGVPILGLLHQPITGELWRGVTGQASQFRPNQHAAWETLKTRQCATLAQAEISTTSARYFTPYQARAYAQLQQQCLATHHEGDCYAYGLLARGQRDIVMDAGLKPYDILALAPIVNGAGGQLTGWDGAPLTLQHFSSALATGDPLIHQTLLGFLNDTSTKALPVCP